MKILRPNVDVERFFAQLRAAPRRALLLDYDGTLAPFRAKRSEAVPYPGARAHLNAILKAKHTRLVIVSGRAVSDIPSLLGLAAPVELWGSHGWERWTPDGRYELAGWNTAISSGLAKARAWAHANGIGDQLESKPAGIALHWRGLRPDVALAMHARVTADWALLARDSGLKIHQFDGGIELRIPGRDKGFVVATLLAELGAGAVVAYMGDDLTDEDAFKALRDHGLSALVRPEFRPSSADIWLQPPQELLTFLLRWHQTCKNP
jgi:trehalose-phosphatase